MTTRRSREEGEIEYRRQCVKDTWIKLGAFDVTQQQITEVLATDYGITVERSTVSRDLAAIKAAMRKQTPAELKSFLMAEYLFVIREERAAWKRSLEDAITETTEVVETPEAGQVDKDGKPKTSERVKAQTRREGQSGNPAHLAQFQAALRAIREMFAVDGVKDAEPINLTSIADVIKLLETMANDALTSESSTRRARTVGQLATAFVSAFQVGEFEARVAALEAALGENKPNEQDND